MKRLFSFLLVALATLSTLSAVGCTTAPIAGAGTVAQASGDTTCRRFLMAGAETKPVLCRTRAQWVELEQRVAADHPGVTCRRFWLPLSVRCQNAEQWKSFDRAGYPGIALGFPNPVPPDVNQGPGFLHQ
jgi:hypothetical protein